MQTTLKNRLRKTFVLASVVLGGWDLAAEASVRAALPEVKLTVEPGHPWTPPFGVERVGRPMAVTLSQPAKLKLEFGGAN